jgi:suppressor of fused-like protein
MNLPPGRMDLENNVPPQGGATRGSTLAPGLSSIITATHRLYPNQKNPLQVTAVVKYWLGGPDPLDYINMFSNSGTQDSEQHWHYVSCGLSDLHGDARVHPPAPSPEHPSGYGFELTFRLKREPGQNQPPTWPAALLNSISKYVFESENKLVPGDHINWGKPLDGAASILKHLLVAEDPQLDVLSTSLGKVYFLQLIGITDEELKSVQRWNGPGISKLLGASVETGGSLLITNPYRPGLFDIKPEARQLVDLGISQEGSNLCGMAAMISWVEPDLLKARDTKQGTQESALNNWESLARQCDRLIETNTGYQNRITFPKSISLACNLETAKFLPLCIQGRLKHGYHFTLKSIVKETAVTFVVSQVAGTLVSPEKPFAAQGEWLQVLIKDSFLDEFYSRVIDVENNLILPYTFQWPDQRISLTVFNDDAEMLHAMPN